MRLRLALLLALALVGAGFGAAQSGQATGVQEAPPAALLTNLDHLRFLTDIFDVEGEPHLGVWIYAEPSPTNPGAYEPRDVAAEGATDIDDVARAAVAYLWWYRAHGSGEFGADAGGATADQVLELARGLLGFTVAMQAEDGEFYNFVFVDGRINRLGITSRKGAGFWAARALWALAEGMRVFAEVDPAFAAELRDSFLRGLPPFEAKIAPRYGEFNLRHGFSAPAWLPDDGADVASNLLLGLSIFLQQEEHQDVRRLQAMVADGLTEFQFGPAGSYPFLAHLSFARDPLDWHAWGSRQTQALAQAALAAQATLPGGTADTAGASDYLSSAEQEAAHFFVHLLADRGPYSSMNPAVRVYPQIAYGMEALASGFFALADASGKTVFDELGGLMAGWLLGNNNLRQAMYDPTTGRVYDGLERGVINRNAGAESTITGLMALLQAEARPAARAMLDLVWLDARADITVEAESGTDFGEAPPTEVDGTASGQLTTILRPGASLSLRAEIPAAGRYIVYALHRNEPWEASANVFIGRERLGTISAGGASESRFRMTELGMADLAAGALSLTVSHAGGRDLRFDALVLRPEYVWKLYGKPGERLLLVKSWSGEDGATTLPVAVPPQAEVRLFSPRADLVTQGSLAEVDSAIAELPSAVELPAYGFALLRWASDEPLPAFVQTQTREGPIVPLGAAAQTESLLLLDLTPVYNVDAFSLSSRPQRGNFDNRSGVYGATYPAERAPDPSSEFSVDGVSFVFPPTDTEANNAALLGQRLEVPAGQYRQLHLLGSSEQGNYQEPLRLVYQDGSMAEVLLGLSDWCQLPRYGETVAVEFSQRRGAGGAVERITCRIFMQSVAVDPGKTLVRVDLPDRETMHIFSLTLELATASEDQERQ